MKVGCGILNYNYVYLIVGVSIVVIGVLLIIPLQPKKIGVSPIPQIELSCDSGTDPLIVGFFLNDSEHIYKAKTWDWGDGKIEENAVNVNNHRYELPCVESNETHQCMPQKPMTFNGSVTEWENFEKRIPYGYDNFTITVNPKPQTKILTGFDQWEGVVIENDFIGFSTSTKGDVTNVPLFTWNWSDDTSNNSGPEERSPSHQYVNTGAYNGTLLVQDPYSPTQDTKNFCALVLPAKSTITGEINVSFAEDPSQKQFYINYPLEFTTNWVSYNAPLSRDFYNSTSEWNLGDNTTSLSYCQHEHVTPSCHTYKTKGNYTVIYNGTDTDGFPATMTKTIRIFPLPSIHSDWFHNSKGITISIQGINFSPSTTFVNIKLDRDIKLTMPVTAGQFDGSFKVTKILGEHHVTAMSTRCPTISNCVDNATTTIDIK